MITVIGRVLERRDTTTAWNYANPILPDGQLGWEYTSPSVPIGVKMGDGSTAWEDLPYWFSAATEIVRLKKPFSSITGFTITWAVDLADGVHTYFELFGNLVPDPAVWFGDVSDGFVQNGNKPTVNEDIYGIVTTVVFDWGVSQSGYVRWN